MDISLPSNLTIDDQEDDEEHNPEVIFDFDDCGISSKAQDDTHNVDDNDAKHQRDGIIGNGGEGLTTSDTSNCGPSDLLNHIQDGNDLGWPPSKAVPRDSDLTKSSCRAEGRTPSLWRGKQALVISN